MNFYCFLLNQDFDYVQGKTQVTEDKETMAANLVSYMEQRQSVHRVCNRWQILESSSHKYMTSEAPHHEREAIFGDLQHLSETFN